MRIIAVDDEKIALEALAGAIKAIVAEDEVVTFRYPEDALEYAKENLCDIILVFIQRQQVTVKATATLPRRDFK